MVCWKRIVILSCADMIVQDSPSDAAENPGIEGGRETHTRDPVKSTRTLMMAGLWVRDSTRAQGKEAEDAVEVSSRILQKLP
jgi:hypothetical protein